MLAARLAFILAATLAALVVTTGPTASADAVQPTTARTVLLVDHSGWPGAGAVADSWNASNLVDLRLADHCAAGVYCITLAPAYDYADSGWMGLHGYVGRSHSLVLLNNGHAYARWTHKAADRSALICHEVGHALGVPHPPAGVDYGPGCISAPDHWHTTPTASANDLRLLAEHADQARHDGYSALAYIARRTR